MLMNNYGMNEHEQTNATTTTTTHPLGTTATAVHQYQTITLINTAVRTFPGTNLQVLRIVSLV